MNPNEGTDLESVRQLAERFAGKELEPKVLEFENYPYAPFNQAALEVAEELGFLCLILPEERGGSGMGMRALCEILREVAAVDAGIAAVIFVSNLARSALFRWGAPEGLDPVDSASLIAFPVYELPRDLPRNLVAEKKGDGYLLSGSVEYLALAPVAGALLLPVQVKGTDRIGFFVADPKTEGIRVGEPVLSLGLRTCPAADVSFDRVTLPEGNLLCEDADSGYPLLAASFGPAAAALAVGVLTGSYEAAMQYARDRYQGGRMIVDYDQVRLMLANMAVIAETGRALVDCMALAVENDDPGPLSDAGLILITEQTSRAATDGVQVLGGYGYMQDYRQEKRMRDAKQIEAIFGAAPAKRLELMAKLLKQEP